MISEISNLITAMSAIFIAVTIPTFTFASTLLNKTLSRLEKEKKDAIKKGNEDVDQRIKQLSKQLKTLNKKGEQKRSRNLEIQLKELKNKEDEVEKKVKKLERRFSSLVLLNSVTLPTGSLLLATVFSALTRDVSPVILQVWSLDLSTNLLFLICASLCFLYSLVKIYETLSLIQEVSLPTDNFQTEQMATALRRALNEHYAKEKEEVSVSFTDEFTYYSPAVPEKINFDLVLSKGKLLEDAKIMFSIPDTFSFLETGADIQRINSDSTSIPGNYISACLKLGNLSIGIRYTHSLDFKASNKEGEYIFYYQLLANGYKGDIKQVTVTVIDIPF